MPTGIRIERLGATLAALTKEERKAKRDGDVKLRVGYSADYALHVHEDLEAFHAVGNAKFLSGPMVRERKAMRQIIVSNMKRKKGLAFSTLAAGRYVLKVSQTEVPVDTGFLRESGFAELDGL